MIEMNNILEKLKTRFKVVRTTDPADATKLIPWFTMKYQPRAESYLEVKKRMTEKADDTCVCLVLAGDIVKGVGLAYTRKDDVFVWEYHTSRGTPRSVTDELLQAMIEWGKSKGYNKLSGMPNRNPKLWVKRWGCTIGNNSEVYMEI